MKKVRFSRGSKNKKRAKKALKRIKTICGILIREIKRKLSKEGYKRYEKELELFIRVYNQKKNDKNKIYSLHEPGVYCISKGKDHKKYEFGSKVAIAVTKTSNVIVGAVNFSKNVYDGNTLERVLCDIKKIVGRSPKVAICDRGFRGKRKIGETEIVIPTPPSSTDSKYKRRKARQRFRRRASIEPIIGHLKSDFRLVRNYLKGCIGDIINLLLSASAYNFKKLMDQLVLFLFSYLLSLFQEKKVNIVNC